MTDDCLTITRSSRAAPRKSISTRNNTGRWDSVPRSFTASRSGIGSWILNMTCPCRMWPIWIRSAWDAVLRGRDGGIAGDADPGPYLVQHPEGLFPGFMETADGTDFASAWHVH